MCSCRRVNCGKDEIHNTFEQRLRTTQDNSHVNKPIIGCLSPSSNNFLDDEDLLGNQPLGKGGHLDASLGETDPGLWRIIGRRCRKETHA